MVRRVVAWCALLAVCGAGTAFDGGRQARAETERRLALVIGNSAYKQAPLTNPANDARLVAAALRAQKFEVSDYYNGSLKDIKRAVQVFSKTVKENGKDTVAFFFYAGHGIQVKGENYLIPVDANIHTEGDVDIDLVSVSSIMSALDNAQARLNVIVLDACRTNPFGYARSGERGLARVDAPQGSLVAFSTSPGKAATDGEGGSSPYAASLAKGLAEQGVKIEDVFKKVRISVIASTRGEQTPWESTSLTGDFYPAGLAAPAPLASAPASLPVVPPPTLAPVSPAPATENPALAALPATPPATSAAPAEPLPEPKSAPVVKGFRDCPYCPEMALVPAGRFVMGSPVTERGRGDAEGPQHEVSIATPFAVGKYEVTFAEWDVCVKEGGCAYRPSDQGWGRGDRPVINVDWKDAKSFTVWLSRKTGRKYRLLTDAEWEYAARAGSKGDFYTGPTLTRHQAHFNAESTSSVGRFPPNAFGLHDMHGNVQEWVEDCWLAGYEGAPSDGSAQKSAEDCYFHTIRDGAWPGLPRAMRSAARTSGATLAVRSNTVGFRVARDN